MLSVGGGRVARVFVAECQGWSAGKGVAPTPEDIAANLDAIRGEDGYFVPNAATDEMMALVPLYRS